MALNVARKNFQKVHRDFWEKEDITSTRAMIIQNLNSSLPLVFIILPVSIGLTNNLLFYIEGSQKIIPPTTGLFTSIVAF
jgi:hypothetical protein